METHFGAGGGQAIEVRTRFTRDVARPLTCLQLKDSYILGRLLSDPRTTLDRAAEVFKIYQDIRLPFAREVVKNAAKVGLMYEFNSPGLYDAQPISAESEEAELDTTESRLKELGEAIQDMWKWQWEERVEKQWEEAEKRLQHLL